MTSVEDSALELAEILAKEAVERARRAPDEVASKGNPFDVVTTVDTEIESLLRRRIRERFPEHAILGEEEGLQVAQRNGHASSTRSTARSTSRPGSRSRSAPSRFSAATARASERSGTSRRE
jgi:3'-phosphoadenosine 5'-phosphosulfate (PAPS) 3'-phosphatase